MKPWLWVAIMSALIVGLVACSDEQPDLSGPALIMFYTDN
jgi:hypothetical protein